MLKYVAAALLAGTTLASAPAFAQDREAFTGFRVEAIAGYDSVQAGDDASNQSLDGLAYGAGVGFDFNLGGAVVGIEAEYSDSGGEEEFDDTIDNIAYLGTLTLGRDVYIGGRVGFTVTPRTLVYAKAGYTNARLEASYAGGGNAIDFDSSVDGYRLGAGVEQQFGRNVFAKLEYRYSNYSSLNFDDTLFGNDDVSIDLDRHQAVVGVGLRF